MKRKDLIRKVAGRAEEAGVAWSVKREGASHTVYRLGSLSIPIPRHRDIGERLAVEIFQECAPELGERWWR